MLKHALSEPKIQIKKVDTKNQLADILTNGSFSRDEWFNTMRFPTYSGSHFRKLSFSQNREHIVSGAMSKRGQDTNSEEGSPVAKARPTNLVIHSQCKEEVSSQSSGSPVVQGNDDERKRVGLDSEYWGHSDSKFEVGYSPVNREDNVTLVH